MINYLFQSGAGIALFYLLYIVLFRKLTFFSLNRAILISIPLLSMILPFIRFQKVDHLSATYFLPVFEVGSQGMELKTILPPNYPLFSILTFIYFTGLSIMIILLAARIINLYRILGKHDFIDRDGYKVARSNSSFSTFSFFNYIFINEKEKEGDSIIIHHEKWHYKLGHSIDNIYLECLKCIFWFNPFIYMIHREIRSVHEFEVDHLLTLNGNQLSYVDELTDEVMILKEIKLTNTYKSNINLLKRIKMMYKNRTKSLYRLTYLSVLPISFLILFIVACTDEHEISSELDSEILLSKIDTVYTGAQSDELTSMPVFKGGIQELYIYLGKEITYPEIVKEQGLSGKVYVSFVIDNTGKVRDAKVLRGFDPACDVEALRTISNMPDWNPGEKDGEYVAVLMMIPIKFVLK